MLISRRHRFIFVHVDKAAGTSVQAALAPFADRFTGSRLRRRIADLGPVARLPLLRDLVEFGEHPAAVFIRRALPPATWDGCFKFAFVRNPWDRLVSRHRYLRRSPTNRNHARAVRMDFPEFARDEMRRDRLHLRQTGYLCDRDGRLLVDQVGRFENLAEDFRGICDRLGVSCQLPHLNASDKADYRSYYDSSLRDEVGAHFAADCRLFGYHFDGFHAR